MNSIINASLLIVDDNATNLAVLSQALKQCGLKVRMAMDGESALKIVEQHLPDLILLDVMMPGIDGFETCARLKANPVTQPIPVIFMTALTDVESKVKGLSIGAVDYITKPFEQADVLARVSVHLQLSQLTKNLEQSVAERTARLSQALEELQRSQLHLVQSEKMSALGELIAGIAHELNNPIGCIKNNVSPARDYVSDLIKALRFYQQHCPDTALEQAEDLEFAIEDLPKILTSMQLSADRMIDLSIALRNFSRSDATTKQLTHVQDGLDSTLIILGHRLKRNRVGARIEVIKSYTDLPEIECYPGLLNQVFMNLLANAIDALETTPDPKIYIQTTSDANHIQIQITDNGIGMTLEVQHRAFEQLFTTKDINQGTGLGLSISRQIIEEKHQGTLKFVSQVGIGTTFTIVLPAVYHISPTN